MAEETKTELEARIGRAFLEVLISSSSLGLNEIGALFGGSQTFIEAIARINPELELFPVILERSNLADDELIELAKDLIPAKLAELIGAKSVEIIWPVKS